MARPHPSKPIATDYEAILGAARKVREPLAWTIAAAGTLVLPVLMNPAPSPDRAMAGTEALYLLLMSALFTAMMSLCMWAAQRERNRLERAKANGAAASHGTQRAAFFTAGILVCFGFAAFLLYAGVYRSVVSDQGGYVDSGASLDNG